MKLTELIKEIEIIDSGGNLDKDIRGITYSSRQAGPGLLFAAIRGLKTDGHLFINEALEKGAEAVVIEDPQACSDSCTWVLVPNSRQALADLSSVVYGRPSSRLNVIGVTGTNGKTTTTNLITAILEKAGRNPGLIGTIHNRIGHEILPVHHTTPEAPDLQQVMALFLRKGADYAVMEVSSHALELDRVRGTEFDVAVFTNLTQDHLDFHHSMEKYLAAKALLFQGLGRSAYKKRRKFAILNADDPSCQQLAQLTRASIITYGIKNEADLRAENIAVTARGVSYTLKYTHKEIPVKLKMTGMFNVYNTLAATAVGLVEGIDPEIIIQALENTAGIPGRFEKVEAGQEFTVIVDYSHTPDSLKNCLQTARQFVEGRIITVFGCGGDRDRGKRPLMGEIAARFSDYCVVTSDNPRSEDPLAIIEDILPGVCRVAQANSFEVVPDRKKAVYKAIEIAQTKDAVIIAGKGHENYQIIGDKVISFDDREVAREAIIFYQRRNKEAK